MEGTQTVCVLTRTMSKRKFPEPPPPPAPPCAPKLRNLEHHHYNVTDCDITVGFFHNVAQLRTYLG